MSVFTMVALISVSGILAGAFTSWLKYREKQRQERVPEVNPNYEDELSKLQKRVEVLEKIVTDGQYDLKQQIENLKN